SFQMLAAQLFEQALPAAADFVSPRAWAFTLIGIDEYLRRLSGDRRVTQFRELLTAKLMQRYADAADEEWHWFEDTVSYANAKLSHALILSGRCMNNSTLLDLGIKSLRWLIKIQISEAGSFRPVGSNGFYPRGKERALFDQQPIEAQATVSACIEAYQATNDAFWFAHGSLESKPGRGVNAGVSARTGRNAGVAEHTHQFQGAIWEIIGAGEIS